jgi:acetyl esterase/lipase
MDGAVHPPGQAAIGSPGELTQDFHLPSSQDTRRDLLRRSFLLPAASILAAQVSPAQAPGPSARTQQHLAKLKPDIPPDVLVAHSISYRLATRKDADWRRLDIYRQRDRGKLPVLIFFHGGAWRSGHRRQYIHLGVSLALGGIAAVIPSYSQAPTYPFPEPVKDAASVIAWVHENIAPLGGDPNKVFVGGHSSGAQIASLVSLDARYLQFHYMSPSILRGVVSLSGIYKIGAGFEYAFGSNPELWEQASPLNFVQKGAPPFLVLSGSRDARIVTEHTGPFVQKLKAAGVAVTEKVYDGEDHSSMIAFASRRDSELQMQIRSFVKEHT